MPGLPKCGQAAFVRQTGRPRGPRTDAKDGYADHTCHRHEQLVERRLTEAILLELVDEDGNTIGTAEKLSAHQAPGRLHRAFSVFLFDEQGRLLLQRARSGSTTPPASGRTPAAATRIPARRPSRRPPGGRTRSWGISPSLLAEAGTVRYNHPDPESGLVEQEYNHLFVGLVQAPLRPDPEEVGDDGVRDRRRNWRSGMPRPRSRRGS